jgi:nucleoside-diphosphate-sugar epimerase
MRAFVTGATGFLGTNLIQELDKEGWEIIAIHRESSDLRELNKCKNVKLYLGDILDIESLRRAIPEGVDAVFHVAGSVGHLPHSQEGSRYGINQVGTRNVVDVCLEKKVKRFIYTSTVLTYDFHAQQPLTESAPRNMWTRDAYMRSKRLADEEVDKGLAAGLDVVYMHPSGVFGAYDKATWSKMFLEVKRGLILPVTPRGYLSVCHARKVVQAHVVAFHRAVTGRHYLLGGPEASVLEILQEIATLIGKPGPIMEIPKPLFKLFGWTEFLLSTYVLRREPMLTPHTINILTETIFSDSSLAIKELDYDPSSLRTMLEDCHRWMVSEGML